MKWDHMDFLIAEHLASAILTGDYTGLDIDTQETGDQESALCEAFAEENFPEGPTLEEVNPDEERYGYCEITNVWGRVAKIRCNYPIKE